VYADDNADALVANGHGIPGDGKTPRTWVAGDDHFYYPAFTNAEYLVSGEYAAFADYVKSAGVYRCPEDRSTLKKSGHAAGNHVRTYAMNAFLGWASDSEEMDVRYPVMTRSQDLNGGSPSDLFVFIETHPDSLCYPGFLTYMPGGTVDGFYHYPSSLHQQRGSVVFADGHAEVHAWSDPRTIKPLGTKKMSHWDHSPKNPDVTWLREHATYSAAEP
jgi:prepilin-type processing-associated H-X9-DG protein